MRDVLFFPVYGFPGFEEAKNYQVSINRMRPKKEQASIYSDVRHAKYYVPLPDFPALRTARLLQARDKQTIWHKLRDNKSAKPENGYLALMLFSGRLDYEHVCDDGLVPGWVRRLSSGQRECLAAWSRSDGLLHHVQHLSLGGQQVQAHVVRGTRGVVYARVPALNEYGYIEGFEYKALMIAANILDKHTDKDDMLRIVIQPSSGFDFPEAAPRIRLPEPDEVWRQLSERAVQAFAKTCGVLPQEVELRRRLVMDQLSKARKDARNVSEESFGNLLKHVDWADALKLVEEPWQMNEVCRVFGDRRTHYGINGANHPVHVISALMRKLDLPDEQRAELRRMLTDYVVPMSDQPCDLPPGSH